MHFRVRARRVLSLAISIGLAAGVNDADCTAPFTFTGNLDRLTIKVDRPQLSPADIQKLEESMAKASD